MHWSTASLNLVLQGRDLLASVGIAASIYMIDHAKCPTSGMPGSGIEYTLNVSHLDAWQLSGYSAKVASYQAPGRTRSTPTCMRSCPDGTYALRISDVTSRLVSDVETYNFEVEEDESYSAAGLISHNCRVPYDECSWCHNRAATRKQYCTAGMCKAGGCKDNLTRLVKVAGDMHHLHVDNPSPLVWFDFSRVFRQADRISAGATADYLTKAAADDWDLSELMKTAEDATAPYEVIAYQDGRPEKWATKIASQLKLAHGLAALERVEPQRNPEVFRAFQSRKPFPVDVLGQPGTEKCAAALGALANCKIILHVADFARLAGKSEFAKEAAERLPGIYQRLLDDDTLEQRLEQNAFPLAEKLASSRQRAVANLVSADFSLEKEAVWHRSTLAAMRGETLPELKTGFNKTASDNAAAEQLAKDYAIYKIAALEKIAAFDTDLTLTARLAIRQNYV